MFQRRFHTAFRASPPLAVLGNLYDCAIDGRPFRFDRGNPAFEQGIQSISVLRQQSDTSDKPGEASINREDSWRAGSSSWHKGAGQRYRDEDGADPERFWASKGIDTWTKHRLSLLNDTVKTLDISAVNIYSVVANDDLFVTSGNSVLRYNSGSWSAITGADMGLVTSIASNGLDIYAVGPNNARISKPGLDNAFSTWINQPASGSWEKVAYVRGRVLLTNKQFICEWRGGTDAPQLNPSQGAASRITWSAIGEGNSAIYAATVAGPRSQIYKITPLANDPGGNLGVPVPAAPALPTGETVTALYGYLGQLVIGTSKGIRVAEQDGNANLNIGPLIELPNPVTAIDGDGSFVWFSWSNFDTASSGLGRIDLSQQTDAGTFAYASDLMAPTQGVVSTIASFNGDRFFGIAGKGVYKEDSALVASGWLQTGYIRYGIIDPKIPRNVELRHQKLAGAISIDINGDDTGYINVGNSSLEGTVVPTVSFGLRQPAANKFELQLNLSRGASGSPIVEHLELRADPVVERSVSILVPVILTNNDRGYEARHPLDDYETLVSLANAKRVITYQLASKIFTATVQDYQFQPENITSDKTFYNGTMILKLKANA